VCVCVCVVCVFVCVQTYISFDKIDRSLVAEYTLFSVE